MYCGRTMTARMMMIEMTIISSSRVKPRARVRRRKGEAGRRARSAVTFSPLNLFTRSPFLIVLPVAVLLPPVERLLLRARAHVEDVLLAAAGVLRLRLPARTEYPVLLARHRIVRHCAQVDLLLEGE